MNKIFTWKESNSEEWVNFTHNTIDDCIEDAKYRGIKGDIEVVELESTNNKILEHTIKHYSLSTDRETRELHIKSVYKHFKGKLYYVEDMVKNVHNDKIMVLYRDLYGERTLYVRDIEEFLSLVDKNKYPNVDQKHRFELFS